ncbi:hypothetical protein [Streptomyces sp. SID13726]|uniref:hypothetical protein n=1 Tax=Streptomyces sp. SID13726 TaxID=2706058 RepID=UPI0013B5D261|nr:hypothetical protein [Streptomyces sp. SID13726]NEB01349.1 hypothetical protein [Streptomyces sp. SID13726]
MLRSTRFLRSLPLLLALTGACVCAVPQQSASAVGCQGGDCTGHLPNHGAQGEVRYNVHVGNSQEGVAELHSCPITQQTWSGGDDTWLSLGTLRLWEGAYMQADNTSFAGATGDLDVAYDAVPLSPSRGASPCTSRPTAPGTPPPYWPSPRSP